MTKEEIASIATAVKRAGGYYAQYRAMNVMGEGAYRGVTTAMHSIADELSGSIEGFNRVEFIKACGGLDY